MDELQRARAEFEGKATPAIVHGGEPSAVTRNESTSSSDQSELLRALSRGEQGVELCAFVDGAPIDGVILSQLRSKLAEWWKPMTDEAFADLVRLIRGAGWNRARLADAIERFIGGHRYENWRPADLLDTPSPKVYGRDWYLKRLEEARSNGKAIGIYRAGDRVVYGWRDEVRDALPKYDPPKPRPLHPIAALALDTERPEPPTPEVSDDVKRFIALVDKHDRDVADMSDTITRLRAELGAARMERDTANQATQFWKHSAADWEDTATALQVIVSDVIDGRITIDELRARVSDEATADETQTSKVAA
jgi:hypothetical protein